MAKRNGLGKGLDALFMDNTTDDRAITSLRTSEIEPNREQPRTLFDDQALTELADSIREHGVIQPLVVRPLGSGRYQIVAGERRWRAARMAGLTELPVIIRELDDQQTLQIAIIENLQREDLNLMELAQGYQSLMQQHEMTQEQVAAKVGKSRSVVANTIRLLALPEAVQELVKEGNLSFGHARAILSLESGELMEKVAQKVVREGLLVRDIEKMGRMLKEQPESQEQTKGEKDSKDADFGGGRAYFKEMELALQELLGRKVRIAATGEKGTVEMEFYGKEDLSQLADLLTQLK